MRHSWLTGRLVWCEWAGRFVVTNSYLDGQCPACYTKFQSDDPPLTWQKEGENRGTQRSAAAS